MYSLFLDTTSGLTIGLLDESYSWVNYESTDEKKPSEVIHQKIFAILNQASLELGNINLITIAGPGSYTGMRLSEGFSDIAKWSGVQTFSFYHFEVPNWVGINSGRWITNAFKKQIFSFQWNNENSSTELLNHCEDPHAYTIDQTRKLIFSNPKLIFSKIILEKRKMETYYFRTLEEEFGN